MRVLLVSTYDLGRQSFGLASPAAWLLARGHRVTLADSSVAPLSPEAVRDAQAIAFYLPMHTATRLADPLIRRARAANPSALLLAYGLYAPLNEPYLRSLGVAHVLGGEFEQALALAIEGHAPSHPVSLDRLAFLTPHRSSLPPPSSYARLIDGPHTRLAGSTEASRGCLHTCRHCPIPAVYGGRFRIVQPDVVLADIGFQAAAGVAHITFSDPDFFNGPTHARRLVESLHASWPYLTYDVTIKIEHILKNRHLLPVLKATGCLFITSAVESTEARVLQALAKGHTKEDFLQALALTRAAGLPLTPTFVPFTPWSTLEGYRDLLQTLALNALTDAVAPIQLALRLLIPQGSLLLADPSLTPHLKAYDPAALLHRWTHPDDAVEQLAHQANLIVKTADKHPAARRRTFEALARAAGLHHLPDSTELQPRATIPYLNEPWYC